MEFLRNINILEISSVFIVMFAIIDITGSIPIFLNMQKQNKKINAFQASFLSLCFFIVFFYAGDAMLKLFNVDIASFAVAGSIVIFILALEMILGIEIMKSEGAGTSATVVPIVFPLIAGPGALTAMLSLRAEYQDVNIIIALVLNLILAYIVLRSVNKIERLLGGNAIYILRKFFGVILLAMAVKLFASNLTIMIDNITGR